MLRVRVGKVGEHSLHVRMHGLSIYEPPPHSMVSELYTPVNIEGAAGAANGHSEAFSAKPKADMGAMRGLLAEMGGLSALAPTRLEGRGTGLVHSVHETWNNTLGMTNAKYVYDACWALCQEGKAQKGYNGQPVTAAKLPEAVLTGLYDLQKLLVEPCDIAKIHDGYAGILDGLRRKWTHS
jgi:hypothetical protein